MPLIPLEPIQDRVIVKRTETGARRKQKADEDIRKGQPVQVALA